MQEVNEILSRYYGQEVVCGYTHGGWPVIRPAGKPEEVVAGGMGGTVPPMVESLLEKQRALMAAIAEIEDCLDERDRLLAELEEAP